uniref:V-type ATP synthase subunit I n=1 Tax=Ignisphaera aggregans TaxID=334771 RepID=A0A7J3MXC6_9CREN
MLLILGLLYALDFLSRRGMKPMYGFVNEELYAFVEQNSLYIQLTSYAFVGLLAASRIKTMGVLGAILWIFDLSGALGDVFSFIRIAGIALGTILLTNVFNQIIYSAIGMNIGLGILMAIISHFIVFVLSPLGPFVHSLRLCILEIGSKIYEGQNRRLSPLTAKMPSRIVISREK